ncbi:MAG: NTP transferase domain-containing protein [Syntrophales bacterium]|nr:NTP transferase domain-containing protein [Syntrophales bacterium]
MKAEDSIATIILAAGKGTRMKSPLAKVLHPLLGKPMLMFTVERARVIGSSRIVVVIGHQADLIRDTVRDPSLTYVVQERQLGTGHAVLMTEPSLRDFRGTILILCGDVPLLRKYTLDKLMEEHSSSRADLTVLTVVLDNPSGYGRIVRGEGGIIRKIVEDKDSSADEKKIREINTGIYCARSGFLYEAVAQIRNENAQGEYYLTDIVGIAGRSGLRACASVAEDFREVLGINTVEELSAAEAILRDRGE